MARAVIKGLPGNRRPRPQHETPTAGDLVERTFNREAPNRLWVTGITEHRTYEGKVYCAVMLDTFSLRLRHPLTHPIVSAGSPGTRKRG
jgi:putative transposase